MGRMRWPRRFVNVDAARARFGDRVDRLGDLLMIGDPLADAAAAALAELPGDARARTVDVALKRGIDAVPDAPEAVARLFTQLERVPFWVDFARCDRGGEAFLAAGGFGGLVLAVLSLVAGYCSPAGNKPLAFSGRLREAAPRRLAETGRFVQAVSLPGGMRRRADGFEITVKVRLMHAQVRRMLLASPDWDSGEWGVPINQADMAGTVMLFSLVVIDGLRKLGVTPTARGSEDLMHLWRYVGYVIGVDQDLLCASEAEGRVLWDTLSATQDVPDKDARDLAAALLETSGARGTTPRERARMIAFGYGASRYLIGDRYADYLGFPKTPWQLILPAMRPAIGLANAAAQRTSIGRRVATLLGARHWSNAVETSLGGIPATFRMPDKLAAF